MTVLCESMYNTPPDHQFVYGLVKFTHGEHEIASRVVNDNKVSGAQDHSSCLLLLFQCLAVGNVPMCAYLSEPQWLLRLSSLHKV